MSDILKYAPPGFRARTWQEAALKEIESHWNSHDVFVIPASVGWGKSFAAMTLGNWCDKVHGKTTAIVTPRVALQEQYHRSFPNVPILKGKGRYRCKSNKFLSCAESKESKLCKVGKHCVYTQTRKLVAESNQAVFNFSSYLYDVYHKKARDVLIVDEAHLLHGFLQDQYSLSIWKHKEGYPDGALTVGDVAVWLERRLKDLEQEIADAKQRLAAAATRKNLNTFKSLLRTHGRYEKVLAGLHNSPTNYFVEKTMAPYNGTPSELLRIRPQVLTGLPSKMWGDNTKIILLSGSISEVDIRRLAIGGSRRVKWLDTYNPIDPQQRPVSVVGAINMGYRYQEKNLPILANKINSILDSQPGKGIVHITYAMANKLKNLLDNPRLIWHNKEDKEGKLQTFLNSENGVLMACGMSEGLDLAGEDYTWQIIGKIMFPSRADPLIEKWYREDPEWVNWIAVRNTLQQCGRICRGPDDYGITYILDSNFGNLEKRRNGLVMWAKDMFPQDFLEAVIWK